MTSSQEGRRVVTGDGLSSLGDRLGAVHDRIRVGVPGVDRVSLALHDAEDDTLRTYLSSTEEPAGNLVAYQYQLADSESLSALARSRQARLLTDLPATLVPDTEHSRYVLEEGFVESLTVPLADGAQFVGFLFYDSRTAGTFTEAAQRELLLYANVILLGVLQEFVAVRSVVGTIQIARQFTELRDLETGAHLERVARFARLVASGIGPGRGHSDEWVERVFLYAPLHDIGKIGIPDVILHKPGRLAADEWEVMKTHTTLGGRMVRNITRELRVTTEAEDRMMTNIVELHHETLDGTGYPHGLRGDEVPDEARVVAVADVYDALTGERPYKQAWSHEEAVGKLAELASAGRLDPECVEVLVGSPEEVAAIRAAHPETA
ncbi:MAG: HD-GYP domain-containing protein [Microthrixaceae bacterium]